MGAAEMAETHVSWVVLLGDRAYKLLKPVDLGFLDHRARADRERACHRETEVNRRFAPDVYLGVLDVLDEGGRPRDHLIEMRRMPAERRLSALLATDEAPERVAEVARAVAAIHDAAPRSPEISRAGEPASVVANWRQGLAQVDEVAGDLLPLGERRRVAELAMTYLDGRSGLLARRIEEGWVRDGHGDLLCDDVFCLDDGPAAAGLPRLRRPSAPCRRAGRRGVPRHGHRGARRGGTRPPHARGLVARARRAASGVARGPLRRLPGPRPGEGRVPAARAGRRARRNRGPAPSRAVPAPPGARPRPPRAGGRSAGNREVHRRRGPRRADGLDGPPLGRVAPLAARARGSSRRRAVQRGPLLA